MKKRGKIIGKKRENIVGKEKKKNDKWKEKKKRMKKERDFFLFLRSFFRKKKKFFFFFLFFYKRHNRYYVIYNTKFPFNLKKKKKKLKIIKRRKKNYNYNKKKRKMGNEQSGGKQPKQRLTEPILTTYETVEDLQEALQKAGLESSNLIIGIDYTGSNASSGMKTYGKNLHSNDESNPNPYIRVMDILGRTMEKFDDDRLIPVFGFGDAKTTDRSVFNINKSGQPCHGIQEALTTYKEVTKTLTLSGPTSFVPLVKEAISIVKKTKQYHILVIICDGQVTDVDANRKIIEEASEYPLSIICVGVGDGPFGIMEKFDDVIKKSKFDNFNFVNYYKTCEHFVENPDISFDCVAMHEIPEQYAIIKQLGYLDL